ncbi:hypothetical protein LOTGIDRAFT_141157 [Lottia gigantea]|uniref:Bystin n=1 Tax=Lottia gigantea TaxID=225164 RepID=V4B1L4_LOTGI|nr:hypothetical protein LOTGIDRAFT_141157 [Lottia gigantea]ESP00212.1 hypothetical protein LOTGIDRAFT_141157 [Lottia gigantea]
MGLVEQMLEDRSVRKEARVKSRKNPTEDDDTVIDDKLSRKILKQAKAQQLELEEEHGIKKFVSLGDGSDDDDNDSDDNAPSDNDDFCEEIKINPDDEKALELFMSKNPPVQRTLADIIMEKLTEKQTEIKSQLSQGSDLHVEKIDNRITRMYKSIKQILVKYRSGKLPKAFKFIPNLRNWEQILQITEPESWSAAAMYQATRIFTANLKSKMAQRYFNLILLPRIRDDIAEYNRLNFHLYLAIRKSLFKPAAFFKGVLLPLCEAGDCTLREAIIMSSILAKCSIPMLHSAAAILKIAEMNYNGANSIFLRTLFDKKYALPYRVVDAVVHHYLGFRSDKRELPVLWHQSLLTFVQRYKEDISTEQKEALMELLRLHTHHQITDEIRRELLLSKCRDVEDGSSTVMQIN